MVFISSGNCSNSSSSHSQLRVCNMTKGCEFVSYALGRFGHFVLGICFSCFTQCFETCLSLVNFSLFSPFEFDRSSWGQNSMNNVSSHRGSPICSAKHLVTSLYS